MAPDDSPTWPTLLQLPEVVGLAGAISARWNVWTGLVTPSGRRFPIRSPYLAPKGPALPVCERFKQRGDEVGSCRASMVLWAHRGQAEALRCHAGLVALIQPVELPHLGRAALYASGFLRAEDGPAEIATLRERARVLVVADAALREELGGVPRLDAGARTEVATWLAAMGRALELAAAARGGEGRAAPRRDYADIVGRSPAILKLFTMLDRLADSDATILIQGENGTGKELFAQAIHTNGRRRSRAFVSQNCAALNDNLLESELFGHKLGAFTGAVSDKRGLFELADGGTLFLDEVGDMSPAMQVKLLRVLQEQAFVPVGDTVTRRVDVRVIAASNRDLAEMVREGSFREDLFYRLNVISLRVPPLRERREDIPILTTHFLDDYANRRGLPPKSIAEEALATLVAWSWPGNVRELRHECERLFVLSGEAATIDAELISPRIRKRASAEAQPYGIAPSANLPAAVEALERRLIREALEASGWNKTRAAKRLGISRRNLIRKVQAWDLQPAPEREP